MATPGDVNIEEEKCQHGYTCTFKITNLEDRLKCSSCGNVARKPSITTCCSEQYCKSYLEGREHCPNTECKKSLHFAANKFADQDISKLNVFCTMKQNGCNWEGQVGSLDTHVEVDCEHVYVRCTTGCGQQIKRGQLEQHLEKECPEREYSCPHCNYRGPYRLVVSAHFAECSYYPVECPNKCGVEGERDDMDHHLRDACPLQYIQCKFSHAGCGEKFRRDGESEHMKERSQKHLELLGSLTLQQSEQIEKQEKEIVEQKREITEQKREITEQKREITEQKREVTELRDRQEQDKKRIDMLMKQVSNITNNVPDDVSPPENQDRNENSELAQKMEEKERKILATLDKRILAFEDRLAEIEKRLNNSVANVNVPKQLQEDDPDDPLLFTFEGYSKKKKDKDQWISRSFKTGGYTLKLNIWPNGQGEGNGTHISVWLLQKTTEDDYLMPAEITITLELLNQCCDLYHIQVIKRFNCCNAHYIVGDFSNTFIAHSDLDLDPIKQTEYLKNDSLMFRINTMTAKPQKMEPPLGLEHLD